MINNGVCDQECNNSAHNFDGHDCIPRCSEECLNCLYKECSHDGQDCDLPNICSPGCFKEMLGDHVYHSNQLVY